MSTTIGEATSRVRNVIKSVKSDAFITDRFLYSLILKYARAFIRRQDSLNQLVKFSSLFRTIPCVDLITSNRIEACCGEVSDCLFKRTKEKIPQPIESTFGPIFRFVSSIDGSIEIIQTNPSTYKSMTHQSSFKYNKNKYYWFLNGYLYFPDLQWDAVMIDGVFEGDLSLTGCDTDKCAYRQDQQAPIPDFLFADIDRFVLQEMGIQVQMPEDLKGDKMNQLR